MAKFTEASIVLVGQSNVNQPTVNVQGSFTTQMLREKVVELLRAGDFHTGAVMSSIEHQSGVQVEKRGNS